MKHICIALVMLIALALLAYAAPARAAAETKVTLIHFADYHSHAVPFYSEGVSEQGGLARTIAYLKQAKASNPNTVVLSGGDTMNLGTPAWSDKYQCAEWTLFNGLLDAMAFGNHEPDYGWEVYQKCAASAKYPVLAGNFVVSTTNEPVLTVDKKPYLIKQVGDVKLGIFAIAGPDFPRLVKSTDVPTNTTFLPPLNAARQIVNTLRNDEKVDAVIFIGHQDRESDFQMAKMVPGIDLIMGSHSHYKGEFQIIPGTRTYFISPFQYLTYLSQVELSFSDKKLTGVTGKLVKMDTSIKPDPEVTALVAKMQADLEVDPKYAEKFVVIGSTRVELSNDNLDQGESVLGNFVMDIVRNAAQAHAAFSTSSSFRASIPPGTIRMEDYLTAIPYKNKVLVYDLTGAQIQQLLDFSMEKRGSDNFGVTSGLRYGIVNGKASSVYILSDPTGKSPAYEALNPTKTYQVMTTDYMGRIASGYKDIFGAGSNSVDTNLIVNDVVIAYIQANSPVAAQLEGRVTQGSLPTILPRTGDSVLPNLAVVAAVLLVGAGLLLRGRVMRQR